VVSLTIHVLTGVAVGYFFGVVMWKILHKTHDRDWRRCS